MRLLCAKLRMTNLIKNMKKLSLLTITLVTSAAGLMAQSTNTLSFSGASWNDGGSLNGYFTVSYDATGTPINLLSADVTTGNSTPGFYTEGQTFTGFEYIYDVSGQANTAFGSINATQNPGDGGGFAANEIRLVSSSFPDYSLFLDWQGTTPTALYDGDSMGEHSSENYAGMPAQRYLDSSGGSVGTVPEPTTFALAGLSAAGLLIFRRRK